MEVVILVLLFVQLLVLWQSCQRHPINVHIYLDYDEDYGDPPSTRLEGDEWKDGQPEGEK